MPCLLALPPHHRTIDVCALRMASHACLVHRAPWCDAKPPGSWYTGAWWLGSWFSVGSMRLRFALPDVPTRRRYVLRLGGSF